MTLHHAGITSSQHNQRPNSARMLDHSRNDLSCAVCANGTHCAQDPVGYAYMVG
jgi:hypothetical protein